MLLFKHFPSSLNLFLLLLPQSYSLFPNNYTPILRPSTIRLDPIHSLKRVAHTLMVILSSLDDLSA